MTDARLGTDMVRMIAHMPPRSAIVVRPYAMAADGRTALIRRIRNAGRAKRHLLLIAGPMQPGFDGQHLGGASKGRNFSSSAARKRPPHFLSMPVHNLHERGEAARRGVDAMLISPVWPTRSHPGAKTLGLRGFAHLAGRHRGAIALGGLTARRFATLRQHGAKGWAAIDAWKLQRRENQR